VSAESRTSSSTSEVERLRLENETLSGVVGVVTSGPDLAHILDRVVDLLTRATSSHACFVYLKVGDRLLLRAASPVYSHLVGKISFGAEQGLAGWAMLHEEPAFVRDSAIDDPRTIYVAELEEERFQSMVAVPIPSRAAKSIGAIVLHTVAPREFDESILAMLSRAASLVAGAIENAQLYEQAGERVEALTQLSALGRELAAVSDRESLHRAVIGGVRALLRADLCRMYRMDESDGELRLVAADPPGEPRNDGAGEAPLILELLESEGPPDDFMLQELAVALGLPERPLEAGAVSLTAGGKRIGVLLAAGSEPWSEAGSELFRAAAQQVALAIEKVDLIERLTEENLARDLFDAIATGQFDVAAEKASAAGLDLDRPHIVLEVRARAEPRDEPWSEQAADAERAIRRWLPAAFCDITPTAVRAVAPAAGEGVAPAREAIAGLAAAAAEQGLAIGVSEAHGGLPGLGQGLREAADAAAITTMLPDLGEVVLYRDTGAYRYLIDLLESGGPQDHLRAAVDEIVVYDRERRSQLLLTLDQYLSQGRSTASTARTLFIHANTLRQRLERIETLTGLSLEEEDLLALQLAVKLARVRTRTSG
jgi:sugar diacid utilization regulator